MRRVAGTAGLLFAVVLTMIACGGGAGDQPAAPETEASTTGAAAAPNTLPEQGPLPAGEYRTETFEPAFSFEVGEGWEVAGPEAQDILGITQGGDSFLGFARPEEVFDPKNPAEREEAPAPETVDGWVAWYKENPYLEASETEPATVGGANGVRLDATVTSAPQDYPQECGAPCVPAFPTSGPEIDFYLGDREEDFVLEVGGEPVLVSITAPEDEFDEFLPKAQEVLDTVEWETESE